MLKISSQHGRAIYALLDAAEQDGLMDDESYLKRWRALQARVAITSYSAERVQLWELAKAMDRSGHLEETWIKAHWTRIQNESVPDRPEKPVLSSPPPIALRTPKSTSSNQPADVMAKAPRKVLILCTGNSARSIMAEFLLRAKGKGRFETFSAGAKPNGQVHPLALWVLKDRYDLDASNARSKSWEEYKDVHFDFVITVCDHARESCPIWPGQPIVAHWSSPDPAAFVGTEDEKKQFFVQVASQISQRIDLLCAFPEERIHALALQEMGEKFPLLDITQNPK